MSKSVYKKQIVKQDESNSSRILAGVPIKVSFVRGKEVLNSYEDVIDIDISSDTPEGQSNVRSFFT